jgi:hypothetical protein
LDEKVGDEFADRELLKEICVLNEEKIQSRCIFMPVIFVKIENWMYQ